MTEQDTSLPIVERLRERIGTGHLYDDGFVIVGAGKVSSRPPTEQTRLANRDGPEAAKLIDALVEALEAIRAEPPVNYDSSINADRIIRLVEIANAALTHVENEERETMFAPRFVDLVRNYTTTAGTGDFALGPPVPGYTGFVEALQAGDQFYYSAISIDNPEEREVGRGVLSRDGTISRDPIGGPKTSFSSGTKAIALIAAAECWNDIQRTG